VVDVPLSIDTRKAVVAREALQAGALIVNDVSGLADSEMAQVVAEAGARLAIVHGSRIDDREDLIHALISDLSDLVERALRAGVSQRNIILDPGLGFGKGWLENFEILRRLSELRRLGLPLLVGPSRKGMIGKVLGVDVHDRLEGTIALVTIAIAHGVDMVRVHDVRENVQAARMADVLARNPARRNSMDTDRG
jgi:dihydropteroate synthase